MVQIFWLQNQAKKVGLLFTGQPSAKSEKTDILRNLIFYRSPKNFTEGYSPSLLRLSQKVDAFAVPIYSQSEDLKLPAFHVKTLRVDEYLGENSSLDQRNKT